MLRMTGVCDKALGHHGPLTTRQKGILCFQTSVDGLTETVDEGTVHIFVRLLSDCMQTRISPPRGFPLRAWDRAVRGVLWFVFSTPSVKDVFPFQGVQTCVFL